MTEETNIYYEIVLVVLILTSLFEIGIFIFAWINADKVECNLLWCTFTSGDVVNIENHVSNITSSITATSTCSVNGEEINCSLVDEYLNKFK